MYVMPKLYLSRSSYADSTSIKFILVKAGLNKLFNPTHVNLNVLSY